VSNRNLRSYNALRVAVYVSVADATIHSGTGLVAMPRYIQDWEITLWRISQEIAAKVAPPGKGSPASQAMLLEFLPVEVLTLVPRPMTGFMPDASGKFTPLLTWDVDDESEVHNGEA